MNKMNMHIKYIHSNIIKIIYILNIYNKQFIKHFWDLIFKIDYCKIHSNQDNYVFKNNINI